MALTDTLSFNIAARYERTPNLVRLEQDVELGQVVEVLEALDLLVLGAAVQARW